MDRSTMELLTPHRALKPVLPDLFSRYVEKFRMNLLHPIKVEPKLEATDPPLKPEPNDQPQTPDQIQPSTQTPNEIPQPCPGQKRKHPGKQQKPDPNKPKKQFQFKIRYTPSQKREIWELLKEHDMETVFQMCHTKIPRGTLRGWQKKALRGDNPDRKKGSGRKIRNPQLEERVFRWFLQRRAKQLPVTDMDIRAKGKSIAKELGIDSNFKASCGWVYKFRQRYNLKCRLRTRLATKPASEMRALIARYFDVLNQTVDRFQPCNIWNFDEVRVYFEPNLSRTVEKGCQKNVSIISVGAMNMRMTVILMISASGAMAPPVMLFYNKGFQPFTLKDHPEALIASNRSGYNVEATHYEVVLPHFLKYLQDGSLVIYDECHAHNSKRIENLFQSKNVSVMRIPGGATCLCQPVDFGIGRKVKYEVKRQFVKWLSANFEEITTPKGRRRKSFQKPTNKLVADWVMEGVKSVKQEEILHSFYYTGVTSKEYQKTILDDKVPRFFVTLPKAPDPIANLTKDEPTDPAQPIPAAVLTASKAESAVPATSVSVAPQRPGKIFTTTVDPQPAV